MANRHNYFRRREQGVALITAILITALATVAAAGMLSRQFLDTRRTENVLHSDQAYIYALGVETTAAEILNFVDQDKKVDLRDEFDDFEALLAATAVDGGTIAGRIVQLSGAFPLNNLVDQDGKGQKDNVKALREYLSILADDNPDLFSAGQEYLPQDWIDIDTDTEPGGAEDSQYLNLDKPYRTANRFLASTTELRLMMTDFGFKKEAIDFLLKGGERATPKGAKEQPFINALPLYNATVNINVADKALLKAILQSALQSIGDATIEKIDKQRVDGSPSPVPGQPSIPGSGFKNVGEMLAMIETDLTTPEDKTKFQGVKAVLEKAFSVNTEYFKVESEAVIGNTTVRLNSLLKRDPNASGVVTLWRSIGTE